MRKLPIALCLLLFFVMHGSAEYGPNVRLDDRIDAFMLRLSTRYSIPLPASYYAQPMRTSDVASFLSKAESLDVKGVLSSQESLLLKKLARRMEPSDGLVTWADKQEDLHLALHLSLLGDVRPSFADSAAITVKGIASPLLTGNMGRLSFYSGIDVWTEARSDTMFPGCDYQPYHGVPYNLYRSADGVSSHVRASDLPRGGIVYQANQRMQFAMAIDYLKIGPALYYPVALSGTVPPITYFSGTLDLKVLQYTHIAGLLQSQKDKTKYLYLHRFNIPLWKQKLILGINEMIVYGSTTDQQDSLGPNALQKKFYGMERTWSWSYMIPFVPFKFAEHYNGDRDNALISFDADLNYPEHFRWYGEFLIDDMLSPWQIFNDHWSNKWAMDVGMQYFGRFRGRDVEAGIEYSHVEPWVYTHFYGGSHSYSHFDKCLGSPLGPNSQALIAVCKIALSSRNTMGLSLTHIAKNSAARGGNFTDVFQDTSGGVRNQDRLTKRFLGPGTRWYLRPGLLWTYNPFGRFTISSRYEVDLLDDKGKASLAAWGGLVF